MRLAVNGRRRRLASAALAVAAGAALCATGTALADVPIGVVAPKVAAPGDEVRVILENTCEGVTIGEVTVLLWPGLLIDPGSEDVAVVKVEAADRGGYTFTVPRLAPGPYAVNVQCGSDRIAFTDNGAGPLFTVLGRLGPGARFDAYLFDPCDGDLALADGPDLRVLGAHVTDIDSASDSRLVPVEVVSHGAAGDGEGVWAELRVPRMASGPLHLYTECRESFRFQGELTGGLPVVEIKGTPDTSTRPGTGGGAPWALLFAAGVGWAAVSRRLAGRPRRR